MHFLGYDVCVGLPHLISVINMKMSFAGGRFFFSFNNLK